VGFDRNLHLVDTFNCRLNQVFLLFHWPSEPAIYKYMTDLLGQQKTSCRQRQDMVCCGLWPQINEVSITENDLLLHFAVKWT